MPYLETVRLRMVPVTWEVAEAAGKSAEALTELLSCPIAAGWPSCLEVWPLKAERLRLKRHEDEWDGLIIHKEDATVIGEMGLKGGPNETGTADLGYCIAPAYRGYGYATEMAQALLQWAFCQPELQRVTADCRADNLASVRVLEKLGMRCVQQQGGWLYWSREG